VLVVLGAALYALRPLWSADLFWHLSNGRLILATRTLPASDPFTYTAINPWVHHEWLSEVVLALAERAVGLAGLRLFRAALVVLGLLVLWRLTRRLAEPGRFAVIAIAWAGLLPNASLRPHLVVWPLAVAVLAGAAGPAIDAWNRQAVLRTRLLTSLGLFAAVVCWVNLHSSALIMPLVLGADAIGRAIDRALGRTDRLLRGSAIAAAFTAAACMVQPAGVELLRYGAETRAVNVISQEWLPLLTAETWHGVPSAIVIWLVLALATLAVGIRERLHRSIPPGFPGFWAAVAVLVLAAQHRRMMVFWFLPALWLAPSLSRAWSAVSRPSQRALVVVAIVSSAALVAIEVPDAMTRGALRPGAYPVAATAFLVATDLDGRIFNDLGWGGFLEYHRFPRQQVFGDGRWLLGGPAMLIDYQLMVLRSAPRDAVEARFAHWQVAVLVQPTRVVATRPALDPALWRLAWTDPTATVLLRLGEGFEERRSRVCAFYAAHPELAEHWSWPAETATTRAAETAAIPPLSRQCPGSAGDLVDPSVRLVG
jgi:hypothetical protein